MKVDGVNLLVNLLKANGEGLKKENMSTEKAETKSITHNNSQPLLTKLETQDLKAILVNQGFMATEKNLEIVRRLIRSGMKINSNNIKETLEILSSLFNADNTSISENRKIDLAIFILSRNLSKEPLIKDLLIEYFNNDRLVGDMKEKLLNEQQLDKGLKQLVEHLFFETSVNSLGKKDLPYLYHQFSLHKDEGFDTLELFILDRGHQFNFCIHSKSLGQLKINSKLQGRNLDLQIGVESETVLALAEKHLELLISRLEKLPYNINSISCFIDKKSSFEYVEDLLDAPKYKLDTRI